MSCAVLIEILGAAAMTTFTAKETWSNAYTAEGLGGLLGAPLIGPMGGFGRFCMVVLALSIISNNIPVALIPFLFLRSFPSTRG